MKDLSDDPYAVHSLVAGSSMAAGNTINRSAEKWAMTAPGSAPVDPLPENDVQDDPNLDFSNKKPVGSGAEPRVSTSYTPGPCEWKKL